MPAATRSADVAGDAISGVLVELGLAADPQAIRYTALAGGVSSDIWKAETPTGTYCVKRARAKLAVQADWQAPVERNHYEAEFLRVAAELAPGLAPELIAEHEPARLVVMPYFPPHIWQVWKTALLHGDADPGIGTSVGAGLGLLHRRSRNQAAIAGRFETTGLFHALRLDPYLAECGRRHGRLAQPLQRIIEETAARNEVLVHGDLSPKNILATTDGRICLLDAECAWFGDPAFDPAFLLNHFLLKMVHRPQAADRYAGVAEAFLSAYLEHGRDPDEPALKRRISRLLAGLFLARVDGKSPVEYLTQEGQRAVVRKIAIHFLLDPADEPAALLKATHSEVG